MTSMHKNERKKDPIMFSMRGERSTRGSTNEIQVTTEEVVDALLKNSAFFKDTTTARHIPVFDTQGTSSKRELYAKWLVPNML
jgi:hypothetical protein